MSVTPKADLDAIRELIIEHIQPPSPLVKGDPDPADPVLKRVSLEAALLAHAVHELQLIRMTLIRAVGDPRE
jgi:hypothetical protein